MNMGWDQKPPVTVVTGPLQHLQVLTRELFIGNAIGAAACVSTVPQLELLADWRLGLGQ